MCEEAECFVFDGVCAREVFWNRGFDLLDYEVFFEQQMLVLELLLGIGVFFDAIRHRDVSFLSELSNSHAFFEIDELCVAVVCVVEMDCVGHFEREVRLDVAKVLRWMEEDVVKCVELCFIWEIVAHVEGCEDVFYCGSVGQRKAVRGCGCINRCFDCMVVRGVYFWLLERPDFFDEPFWGGHAHCKILSKLLQLLR